MSLGAVTLMFWPLLYFGYQDGKFHLLEVITLAAVWILIAATVFAVGASLWYFAIPATALTIFMIVKVLGWDAPSHGL